MRRLEPRHERDRHHGTHGRHTSHPVQRRDGHDAGQDGLLDPEIGHVAHELHPLVRIKEELGHGEVGGFELSREVPAVFDTTRRSGVTLRMSANADAELSHFAGELHEFERVAKLRGSVGVVLGQITAERHDVDDTRVGVVLQQVPHLIAAMTHADEVRHRRELARALNSCHEVERALTRFAPPSIGH